MENIKPRNTYTRRWKCEWCKFTMETHEPNKVFPETHPTGAWGPGVQRVL
jgi:hypothetical protein